MFYLFVIGYLILLIIGFQITRKAMDRGWSAVAYGIVFVICAAVLLVVYTAIAISFSGIQC
ncbi:hypothetical protein D0C36_05885 [Mucilaginibacter conchicola]|uniref:Uncharacterized protein n=1 Tax=Mucilaginibacter conchicola TaxID=2303333 RepID=A0A372NY63_9SPHI|nr:hypothetical protein [Mucilaginibacter conchicola]RFZ95055.1 hypothetical protein D0C36_05885 [Mucilaginibacter conchicola]